MELLPQSERKKFHAVVLDFADLSGSPLDTAVEFYRQYHSLVKTRLHRFELVWASMFHARGQMASIDFHGKSALPDSGGDLADLAAGVLDAVGHVPFVGLVPPVLKLGARVVSTLGDRRRLEIIREWFADHLQAKAGANLREALLATPPEKLEALIPEALAADLLERQESADESSGLLVISDRYDAVTIGRVSHVDRSTFIYRLADRLRVVNANALFVISGQHSLRWSDGSAGEVWQDLFEEHELLPFDSGESIGYIEARGIRDERLTERLHLISRGCPALLAAALDLIQDEDMTAAWQSLDELRDDLGRLNPASEEGRGVFFSWYVRRLRATLSARDDRYFDLVVAGSVLRSFDPALLGIVLTTMEPIPALDAIGRYSFLEELATSTAGRVPLRQRRYRIHGLVRQAVALSELYQDGVRAGHRRAREHFAMLTDDPATDSDVQRYALASVYYHETCLNPDAGLRRCEDAFRRFIDMHDLTQCDYIIEALYDAPLVDPETRAQLLVLDSRRRRARHEYREAIESLSDARSRVVSLAAPTPVSVDIMRNLAECYRLCGEPHNAYAAWDELWEAGTLLNDPGVQFVAAEGQLRSRIDHDELREAAALVDRTVRLLDGLENRGGSRVYPYLSETLLLRRGHLERQFSRICRFTGDYVGAYRHAQNALEIYRSLNDEYHAAYALLALGHASRAQGDFASAIRAGETASAIFEQSLTAGSTMNRHGDPDAVGVFKVMQLLLLAHLAEDIGVEWPGPRPDVPPSPLLIRQALRRNEAEARRLISLNDDRLVDPYAPIWGRFALGEIARWRANATRDPEERGEYTADAQAEYEAAIASCEKIGGRAEAASARIALADLLRFVDDSESRGTAVSLAHRALSDGVQSDYPWIIFHAAIELSQLDPNDRAIWIDLASDACRRINHPLSPSPFRDLLTAVADSGASPAPPVRLVTP
ncbi:hypothetical protein Aple_071740 [Acrocarpospora pleiomorpha]|uniref:Uncharacterized protein n=1 Tax=Acrocarpospora pleiomorpha TaxID=90975 RepID=A0A5M3XST4_9ACTN|nr:hypothetical protein Aple_071740 [Acrocarpospora pleiomorpha]